VHVSLPQNVCHAYFLDGDGQIQDLSASLDISEERIGKTILLVDGLASHAG
jgi:hypothetical protein